jgi:diaminohydroxyphosphoribosylaminopyrimidine deaminase/5-amino-6-(5-phosphoribosylamino)uracil reductase
MSDTAFMRQALRLARHGYGTTSPNPMVGAVVVRDGQVLGTGWHHRAGQPHAEVEALREVAKRGQSARGATIYVTLEPCCTQGRTPPCTEALMAAGIRRVVAGATDPNPKHGGQGFALLQAAGLEVVSGVLAAECTRLNEVFNHWMTRRTPFVTVKAAMTLDGKIATASGESKWITGEKARAHVMKLRLGSDAILVGINTVLADDPALTVRSKTGGLAKPFRRIILDSSARVPLTAKVIADDQAAQTTVVVGPQAPQVKIAALAQRVTVLNAPVTPAGKLDLPWLLEKLGRDGVASLLVEGGGEVNASFLLGGLAQRVAFFYAPKILGGREARKGVAGDGAASLTEILKLEEVRWQKLGPDLLLTARVG